MKIMLCSHGVLGKAKCKQCQKEYDKKRYLKLRKEIIQRARLFYKTNREKIRIYRQHRNIIEHEKILAQRRNSRIKHLDHVQVQNIITRGNRRGKIKYPLAPSCELCPEEDKRTEKLEHAHFDYDYPELYVTACRECHAFADKGLIL